MVKRKSLLICVLFIVAAIASIMTMIKWLRWNSWLAFSGNAFPRIVLWAWERPENLEFINSREVGVAFLARTIYLRGGRVIVRPRLQPLNFARGTALIAVARIEADHTEPPTLSFAQREETASALAELVRLDSIAAIQVDFDARISERAFYRDLLYSLRQRLPAATMLSITALASWCIYDDWLTGLPIDEAVPMLFRLGAEREEVTHYLSKAKPFRCTLCQNSLGISTDETLPRLPLNRERRIYIFNPQPWSESAANKIIGEVQQW